jgi:dephospho-CoA kinase
MSKEGVFMIVVGVTGGIASGKSLISDWFTKANLRVIDADVVYKNLIKSNRNLYKDIVEAFDLPTNQSSSIDFKSLGKIVFRDKEKLKKLNAITHPYVINKVELMLEEYKDNRMDIVILDVPLLYEAKMESYCDYVVCVYTDRETQIDRLMKRGHLDRQTAIKRIDSQMSLEDKKAKSDFVIDNSWSKDHSYQQFVQILANIKSYAKES